MRSKHIVVGITCFLIDRITKMWALYWCSRPYVVTSWCYGELAVNKGIAWSIGAFSSPAILTGIAVIVTIITSLTGLYFFMCHKKAISCAAILVLVGALGNVVDRWVYGGVVDFIVVHYGAWYFPTFNIADVAICCGALWWFLQEIEV